MCSGSEAGSYLRLVDFVCHSTLGWRVIKKKKNPQLSTRQKGPAVVADQTRNPKPHTRNPTPEIRNLKLETRISEAGPGSGAGPNPKPEALYPKPETRSPIPETRHPKPYTRNPTPEIPNPRLSTTRECSGADWYVSLIRFGLRVVLLHVYYFQA
jgi:hypothetical protein